MLAQRAYLAIGKADIAGIDRGREDKSVIKGYSPLLLPVKRGARL